MPICEYRGILFFAYLPQQSVMAFEIVGTIEVMILDTIQEIF